MKRRASRFPIPFLLLLVPVACADEGSEADETVDSAVGASTAAAPAGGAAAEGPTEVSPEDQEAILQTGLLGEWRWTGFQGMDDSTLQVEDPSRYTLTFRVDGVAVQADCNRGRGSYDIEGASITFGPIATTLMACPGESIADRYLRDLGFVRSWVIEDGRLFLSLMADGGIMEFEPGGGPA
ncbi:MAG TPA: META domain-containing protein [Longimicrobiales bacterium]|nr:META domain-containing protein [Longimicrobiales bacterium]